MTEYSKPEEDEAALRAKINGETSRLPFSELMRFFAAGAVIAVSNELDLVEVALRVALDDKAAIAGWMSEGRVARASDAQAQAWVAANTALWTVVVKPWILVQEQALRDVPAASASMH
jgi:hypothetical protein